MALRLHCPHCFRVLMVVDQASGGQRQCPACEQLFDVPRLPAAELRTPEAAPSHCPRCRAEVGATTAYCRKCYTDLKTGQRLPLRRRIRLFPRRLWVLCGATTALAVLLVFVAVQLVLIHTRPVEWTFHPTTARAIPAEDLAARLLTARSPAERAAACDSLRGIEQRAAPAVATALAAALAGHSGDSETRWNQTAAIELLARNGEANRPAVPRWLELLAGCQQEPGLRAAALRARALLGDASVLDELCDAWLTQLQRRLVVARVVRTARTENQPATQLVLRRMGTDGARLGEGLRSLADDGDNLVFERLAQAYWDSWSWLGQDRGEQFAAEVFDLARPPGKTLAFQPEDVRQPRDVLNRVATRGSPLARAAAGLILDQRGPQYRTLARRIGGELVKLLPGAAADELQILTWSAARLRGRTFGSATRSHPRDVTAEDVAAALESARPGSAPSAIGPLPAPPVLTYRAVTVARQTERELLTQLHAGFASAWAAMEEWRAAELGCTPRLRALLDPGQRQPNDSALAAALVIVAQENDATVRQKLELWREATEKPAWIRALAYMVLGSLDARRGHWDSGWPAALDLGDVGLLDRGEPGWEPFGRVLAAGGPAMRQRLVEAKPPPLPPAVTAKLLEAAKRAANRAAAPGPSR